MKIPLTKHDVPPNKYDIPLPFNKMNSTGTVHEQYMNSTSRQDTLLRDRIHPY